MNKSAGTQPGTPTALYTQGVADKRWEDDPAQRAVLAHLDPIQAELVAAEKTKWWQRLRTTPPVRGMYLYGSVGRGKTFLEFTAFRLGVSRIEMEDHKMYYDKQTLWPMLVQAGFRSAFWRVSTDGRAQALPNREMSVGSVAWTLSRERIAEAGETADGLPEVWVGDAADGGLAQVTSLNAPLAAAKLCRPQIYRYKSFDGREIEAALLKPDGASGPLPTIALIHGGPTGAWRDGFEAWGQLLANAGYAVFYPNIRGSTGYGYDFMISNRADWGGGDFKDIMAGLDDLVARRIADPARLGIGGWSYGGYMASWAITQTTRFKAAVSGAGMSDLAHEFSTEDNPAYDEWFYGLPYEKPEGFRRSSPLTYITKAKTPTLILQGEDDVVDPVGQSLALYRALKRYGVEAELVLYPREGHGLREEQHLLDRLRRIVAWYDAHLKAEPTPSR